MLSCTCANVVVRCTHCIIYYIFSVIMFYVEHGAASIGYRILGNINYALKRVSYIQYIMGS